MHAVSDDLLQWQKMPEDTFYAPPDLYESNDWRDPYVSGMRRRENTGCSWRRG